LFVIGGGSSAASTVAALRAVDLQSFDFPAEVARVQAEIRQEVEAKNLGYMVCRWLECPGIFSAAVG
jgi:hypothetical protein